MDKALLELLEEHDKRQSWAGSSYNGSDLQAKTRAKIQQAEREAYEDHLFMQGGTLPNGTEI